MSLTDVGGTGKYDGMTIKGSVREVKPPKEVKPGVFEYCSQNTGTYKMKARG